MSRSGGRPTSRALAAGTALAGAALVVLASGREWVTAAIPDVPGGAVGVDGGTAAPGTVAVALAVAAGAVALLTSGRAARILVAALLLLAGTALVALSVPAWRSPGTAVAPAVARATGTSGVPGGPARTTAWPLVSAAGGLLVTAAGLTGLAFGRRWPAPARRYERGTGPGSGLGSAPGSGPSERDRRADDWDRLSRGEDPTDGPPGT